MMLVHCDSCTGFGLELYEARKTCSEVDLTGQMTLQEP